MSKLLSGLPGSTTGPESLPLASAAAESSRKPPFCFSGPWHCQHLLASSGRTFFSKCSRAAGEGGDAAEVPAAIHNGIKTATIILVSRSIRIRRGRARTGHGHIGRLLKPGLFYRLVRQ